MHLYGGELLLIRFTFHRVKRGYVMHSLGTNCNIRRVPI